ncbi:MAG TPA: hypothetical protein DEO59_01470 [Balneola sp.]|nr:hypothetical protein [Balneola sp.]
MTPQEQKIIDALSGVGFEDDDIPALMGNISVETGGTFDPMQQQEGGTGSGLFQFSGDHLKAYRSWLKAVGFSDTAHNQALFVHTNIYSEDSPYDLGWKAKGMLQNILGGDLYFVPTEEKARIFSDFYQKPGVPHMDRRQEEALRYEGMLAP